MTPTTATDTIPPPPTDPPPIWFLTPEGFFALPVAATAEERARLSDDFVRELYSRGDETVWGPAAPYYAALGELMAGSGVSYAAMGLFSTSEDELTPEGEITRHDPSAGAAQCVFSVAAVPTDQPDHDTDVVAQGIFATLSTDPQNDVQWLDLPCGPAVACATWREFRLEPEMTASGGPTELVTAQVQVYVPFPSGPFTAVFTLFTAAVDHWVKFCELVQAILQTVSFTDPEVVDGAP